MLTPKGEAYVARQLRPLGCPAGVEPRAWRQAIVARVEALQDAAQRLIAALDQMDGDPDLEDTGDEQDAAWPEGRSHLGFTLSDMNEDSEDDGTAEPSLGAPEIIVNPISWHRMLRTNEGAQTHWAKGRGDDDEAVNEDGFDSGFNGEDGPTWAEAVDQTVLEVGLC